MRKTCRSLLLMLLYVCISLCQLNAQQKKPNIVVIVGDDIGMWNVGAHTHGMTGHTPNIDSTRGNTSWDERGPR